LPRASNRSRATRKSRDEHARETREALVKAALHVVSRYGYARASVSRITEASGVAAGTLYSYFQSHQHLLDELLPAEGVRLLDTLGRSGQQSRDYFDHERRTFTAFFSYLKSKPYFLRVLTEAETAAPESYAQHMRNIEDRYLRALHRAHENGDIRGQSDRAFRVIAEVLSGARGHIALGFCNPSGRHAFRPQPLPDWVADTYVKFVRHGLRERTTGTLAPPRLPRRPRPPETDTRSALLASAARVIHAAGYPGATVLAITKAAGVAVGTFYAHFASRQQLFEELLFHVRSEMLADIREAVRGSSSFFDCERRGFYAFFDHLVRNPWYVRIEIEAAVWAPAMYFRHYFDLADRYTASLRRSRARGELQAYEDRELPILAYVFMAARRYLAARFILPGSRPKRLPSWVAESYLDLVSRGLEAPRRSPAATRRGRAASN